MKEIDSKSPTNEENPHFFFLEFLLFEGFFVPLDYTIN